MNRILARLAPRSDGRKVLYALLAFFGAIVAVNGVFVYLALASWNGLTSRNAYQEGLAYNRTIERIRAQAELGWQLDIDYRAGRAAVAVLDRDGRPLDGLRVRVQFMRPTAEGNDLTVGLDAAGGGRYAAAAELPLPGQWDMVVDAEGAPGTFRAVKRILVR